MSKPARRPEALRFALVGAAGFLVDAGMLSTLALLEWNLYAARALSFASAVTTTYLLNRRVTFGVTPVRKGVEGVTAAAYGAIQVGGALVNLAVFSVLIWQEPRLAHWPVLPLAIGAVGGFVFNYLLTSLLFRWRTHHGKC